MHVVSPHTACLWSVHTLHACGQYTLHVCGAQIARSLQASLMGRTEEQLVFCDGSHPLLAAMATGHFTHALAHFQRRVAVGVRQYDTLVPTASACICTGVAESCHASPGAFHLNTEQACFDVGLEVPCDELACQWSWPRQQGWRQCSSGALNLPVQVLRQVTWVPAAQHNSVITIVFDCVRQQ